MAKKAPIKTNLLGFKIKPKKSRHKKRSIRGAKRTSIWAGKHSRGTPRAPMDPKKLSLIYEFISGNKK